MCVCVSSSNYATSRLLQISISLFPNEIYKLKYFTSKLSCFVVPQVGCSSLPVGPAAGTLGPSTATCGGSAGEIKVGCDSVVGGDETLQVVGTPVSNSSESLPSVLVPTTASRQQKGLIMQGHYSQNFIRFTSSYFCAFRLFFFLFFFLQLESGFIFLFFFKLDVLQDDAACDRKAIRSFSRRAILASCERERSE